VPDTPPQLTAQEFERRFARLRAALEEAGLDVGIAAGNQALPGDVQWLTGYDPQLETAAVVVSSRGVYGIGGPEGEAMFSDWAHMGQWRNLDAYKIPGQHYEGLRFATLAEVLEEAVGTMPQTVGLLSKPGVMTWEIVEELQRLGVQPKQHDEILSKLRYEKSELELDLHRHASVTATEAMRAMIAAVRPGVTELEVAAEGDAALKRAGAYSTGFETIVCAGERIATIIGRASRRPITEGELVMLGVAPRWEGYTSALGRMVVAGTPTASQAAFLEHGANALECAAETLAHGVEAREIHNAAHRSLGQNGLGQYHAYGVGHGIGLSECLEERTATSVSDYRIPSGITIMLDVGVYGHPEHVGARHEDPFLITHDGVVERLTDLPMLPAR
jgi:Xaa-Pro aminopeptidase